MCVFPYTLHLVIRCVVYTYTLRNFRHVVYERVIIDYSFLKKCSEWELKKIYIRIIAASTKIQTQVNKFFLSSSTNYAARSNYFVVEWNILYYVYSYYRKFPKNPWSDFPSLSNYRPLSFARIFPLPQFPNSNLFPNSNCTSSSALNPSLLNSLVRRGLVVGGGGAEAFVKNSISLKVAEVWR